MGRILEKFVDKQIPFLEEFFDAEVNDANDDSSNTDSGDDESDYEVDIETEAFWEDALAVTITKASRVEVDAEFYEAPAN